MQLDWAIDASSTAVLVPFMKQTAHQNIHQNVEIQRAVKFVGEVGWASSFLCGLEAPLSLPLLRGGITACILRAFQPNGGSMSSEGSVVVVVRPGCGLC